MTRINHTLAIAAISVLFCFAGTAYSAPGAQPTGSFTGRIQSSKGAKANMEADFTKLCQPPF
jgi:hypothetical protein